MSFFVSTSFLCEQGGRHRVTDVKGPFCEHTFPVVTKREISDLHERFGRVKDTKIEDASSRRQESVL